MDGDGDRGVESARHWQPSELPGVDLLRARYVRKTFVRHTHSSFVIASITEGVEAFRHRSAVYRAGPGSLAVINPDTPHTGYAGVPEGWRYDVLYPDAALVAAVAAETVSVRGTAGFAVPVVGDAVGARLVTSVHRAAEEGDPLAADSLMRTVIARLLRLHGASVPERTVRSAGSAERGARPCPSRGADDGPADAGQARR